ncbi:MAG TPA: TIR domain-containing protein [Noviherbaspirillum sp.]|jgi:hypothetical protein|uniref:TIR domain-containing protein n=1 Tax=Noviherbaspirillum sp. TaxID=1926288 RepID=UPI002F943DE1
MSEHQIFLSYGSPDFSRAKTLYDRLRARGLNVWFDKQELLPGQRWDFEIKRALRQSDIVLFLISNTSLERRGYVQREMKLAISHLEEKLPGDIYAIPILLDNGVKLEPPLSDIQYISAEDVGYEDKLVEAIDAQLAQLGRTVTRAEQQQDISMSKRHEREQWEGLPGYDVEYWLPQFQSTVYPGLHEITTIVESDFLAVRQEHRRQKLAQDTTMFRWSEPMYRRTNTFAATILEYKVIGRLLSLVFVLDFYGAGAAHENYGFKTFNFFLNPLCRIDDVKALFVDPEAAFPVIQRTVRESLKKNLLGEGAGEEDISSIEWIEEGTNSWESLQLFSFAEGSLSIYFAPYTVASFADGPQRVEIPLEPIRHLLDEDLARFLDFPI